MTARTATRPADDLSADNPSHSAGSNSAGLYLELKPDTEVGYLDAALWGNPASRIDGKLYRQVDPSEPETGWAWCDLARRVTSS